MAEAHHLDVSWIEKELISLNWKKSVGALLILMIVLVIIQTITALYQNAEIQKSNVVEQYLPQFTHFSKDTKFDFALIDDEVPIPHQINMKRIVLNYVDTVYADSSFVPRSVPETINTESGPLVLPGTGVYNISWGDDSLACYMGGYKLSWKEIWGTTFLSYSETYDWEAPDATAGSRCLQLWWFNRWIVIWRSWTIVS